MDEHHENEEVNRGLKLIIKSSIVVLIGLTLSKLFTYVYKVILARYFGPEIYGMFSLAIMILGWFTVIAAFGLARGVLRFVSLYRGKKEIAKIKNALRFSLIFLSFSTVFAAIMMYVSADFIAVKIFHTPELIIFLKVFSLFIPFYVFSRVFASIIRAYEKIGWYSFVSNILINFAKVFALILFVLMGFKTNAIIWSYAAGIMSVFIVAYLICRYKVPEIFGPYIINQKIKKEEIKKFFSYSWPIMFFSLMTSIFYEIDSFIIGYFMDVSSVGFYNVAITIVGVMGIAPELFMQLFFPLITKEFSNRNFIVIRELTKQVSKWIFIIILPIFLLLILFPEAIVNLLFGPGYIIAQEPLRIIAVGGLIAALVIPITTNIISMAGKSKLLLLNLILASLFNLILGLLLIPKYGLIGAALSTSFVNVMMSIGLITQTYSLTKAFPFRRKMLRIFSVSLIPIFILFYLKEIVPINNLSLILIGILFLLIYLILIFATGCLDKNDFLILRSIKKKIFKHK